MLLRPMSLLQSTYQIVDQAVVMTVANTTDWHAAFLFRCH